MSASFVGRSETGDYKSRELGGSVMRDALWNEARCYLITRSSRARPPAPHLKPCLRWFGYRFPSCSPITPTLESIQDAESHRNFGNRIAGSGFFACGGKPGGKFFAFNSACARAGGSGILARHVVTELR